MESAISVFPSILLELYGFLNLFFIFFDKVNLIINLKNHKLYKNMIKVVKLVIILKFDPTNNDFIETTMLNHLNNIFLGFLYLNIP